MSEFLRACEVRAAWLAIGALAGAFAVAALWGH